MSHWNSLLLNISSLSCFLSPQFTLLLYIVRASSLEHRSALITAHIKSFLSLSVLNPFWWHSKLDLNLATFAPDSVFNPHCPHWFRGSEPRVDRILRCLGSPVEAMVFPVVMYGCETWTVKKAEHRKIDAFELWCWRRLLRVPWTARRSNQSILK